MSQTATVIFDGQVLRPEQPLDLEPNQRYEVTIKALPSHSESPPETAWDVLDKYAGTLEGPGDWSVEHDHYLYGTPKRHTEES